VPRISSASRSVFLIEMAMGALDGTVLVRDTEAAIEIRQIKYLNNIIEQDHRAIKQLVRPMLGFKSFRSAAVTLAGVELMHMIRTGQLRTTGEVCPARQFYSLAG
jgi:putative transposase